MQRKHKVNNKMCYHLYWTKNRCGLNTPVVDQSVFHWTSQKGQGIGRQPVSCSFLYLTHMKPYAEKFYKSPAWKNTAQAYMKSRSYLCERCLRRGIQRPAEIVHHKTHLSPENISVPEIALSWDNLEAVCRECHSELHNNGLTKRPYRFDSAGRVIER